MFKQLLLLDIDDTICDSTQAYAKAQKACFLYLKKLYPEITENRFNQTYWFARAYVHRHIKDTASSHNRFLYFQRMFEMLKLPIKPKWLNEITELFWQETNRHLKLLPTVKETLRALKGKNIKIGVVSNLLAEVQINKLKHLRITGYIDFIVTSEEAGRDKPDPKIFWLALKKAACRPTDAIMVGNDCEDDIEGANSLGIYSVHLGLEKCPKAKHQIKQFKQILPLLKLGKSEGYVKFNYSWIKGKSLPYGRIKELNQYRQKFYKLGLIGAYPNGIGYGNLSQKCGKSEFIVSGTETGNYPKLKPEHYALVTGWNFSKNHLTCQGPMVASSESLSHAAIYDSDATAKAVIHIHDLKLWNKLLHKAPTTPASAAYGTVAMTKEIRKLFKTAGLKNKKILVMAGHQEGVMAFGRNLKEAADILLGYYRK